MVGLANWPATSIGLRFTPSTEMIRPDWSCPLLFSRPSLDREAVNRFDRQVRRFVLSIK